MNPWIRSDPEAVRRMEAKPAARTGDGKRCIRSVTRCCALFLALALLAACLPGTSYDGEPTPLTAAEEQTQERLKGHVFELADAIGERNFRKPRNLARAVGYIERQFGVSGYAVKRHSFSPSNAEIARVFSARFDRTTAKALSSGLPAKLTFHNLEATLPGTERPEEIIVLGAHYDSANGTPGANDNASGVAALLEMARLLRSERLARTIRFVAFANEEPPFFHTGLMGSRVYARRARAASEDIKAMISLETIGYFTDAPGSQNHPPFLGLLYPDRGNFLAFVANPSSASLLSRSIGAFRRGAEVPSEGLIAPALIAGVDWSDHASFWDQGYDAVMVTDTAPYRYPYYHRSGDTPGRVDDETLTRVVTGLLAVVRDLAGKG